MDVHVKWNCNVHPQQLVNTMEDEMPRILRKSFRGVKELDRDADLRIATDSLLPFLHRVTDAKQTTTT